MLSWQCIGHEPTVWAFGNYYQGSNKLFNIQACVERKNSGEWYWKIYFTDNWGIEPSRMLAIMAVEKIRKKDVERDNSNLPKQNVGLSLFNKWM